MASVIFAAALTVASAQPPELGDVHFRRGYDAAVAEARAKKLPLLVLFDEIPGCATVNAFGADALSNVIVKDALEQLFVSVVVQNNTGGDDRRVLEAFREPTWNNPVVRVLDVSAPSPRELTARLDTPTRAQLLRALVDARRAAKLEVPAWLALVADEENTTRVSKTFSCWCFWEGEAHLGARDGVFTTEAGFVDGREAVRVTFDPRTLDPSALDAAAARDGYTPVAGKFRAAGGNDDKHASARTKYASIEMSAAQRTKVNAAIAAGRDPNPYLSPSQRP